MSDGETKITETLLLGYADGKLSDAERAAVERYLGAHPEKAAEVAHWQLQNEALRALFVPAANEPVPARLDPHLITGSGARILSRLQRPQFAAVVVALIAIGASAGWFGRDLAFPRESPRAVLIESAVTAHALFVNERRHAVEVAASDRAHLLTWLSNRIARPIDSPDLSAEGFDLVGGRLLPASPYSETGPAAQLMYENADAQRVTVYITAAIPGGGTAYEFTSHDSLEAFYWANDTITCTVVGDLPEIEMQTVAKSIYRQLTRRPDYREL